MGVYVFNSEQDVVEFKGAGNTLENFDVIVHKEVPPYVMEVLLVKYFPTLTYQAINVGTDLYSKFGHNSTLVVAK